MGVLHSGPRAWVGDNQVLSTPPSFTTSCILGGPKIPSLSLLPSQGYFLLCWEMDELSLFLGVLTR